MKLLHSNRAFFSLGHGPGPGGRCCNPDRSAGYPCVLIRCRRRVPSRRVCVHTATGLARLSTSDRPVDAGARRGDNSLRRPYRPSPQRCSHSAKPSKDHRARRWVRTRRPGLAGHRYRRTRRWLGNVSVPSRSTLLTAPRIRCLPQAGRSLQKVSGCDEQAECRSNGSLSQRLPNPLGTEAVDAADVVITMGCGDA